MEAATLETVCQTQPSGNPNATSCLSALMQCLWQVLPAILAHRCTVEPTPEEGLTSQAGRIPHPQDERIRNAQSDSNIIPGSGLARVGVMFLCRHRCERVPNRGCPIPY